MEKFIEVVEAELEKQTNEIIEEIVEKKKAELMLQIEEELDKAIRDVVGRTSVKVEQMVSTSKPAETTFKFVVYKTEEGK